MKATARTVRLAGALAVLGAALNAVGCVDRKFFIESNVPNAQVYIDNRLIGAAPAYSSFDYYGDYTITVVHPGYETVVKRQHVAAPWYAYPPFDFFSEILWPGHIRDTRKVYIELHEAQPTKIDDVIARAEALRSQGRALPIPERPAEPRPRPSRPGPNPPVIQPPVSPDPGIVPSPLPPRPAPGPAPGVVPSVTPGYTPASSYIK